MSDLFSHPPKAEAEPANHDQTSTPVQMPVFSDREGQRARSH